MSSEDESVTGAGSLLRVPLADVKTSIAHATVEAGVSVHVHDLAADERYNADVDIEATLEARVCMMSVPVMDEEGQVLAVVQVCMCVCVCVCVHDVCACGR